MSPERATRSIGLRYESVVQIACRRLVCFHPIAIDKPWGIHHAAEIVFLTGVISVLANLILIGVSTETVRGEQQQIGLSSEEVLPEEDPASQNSLDFDERQSSLMDPEAARFDSWEPITTEELQFDWNLPGWCQAGCFETLGFRHSSTHGRNVGRGYPLTNSSWKNRPYHADWFYGGMLNSTLIRNRVLQNNASFGGFRLGWDFDHYWGLEGRVGWSAPNLDYREGNNFDNPNSNLFLSDFDLVYYPWGDSKIRPYVLMGLGFTQIKFYDEYNLRHRTNLLTMPYGVGIQFPQWSWLTWRLEVLNNLAFGADQVETLANVSFTLGLEWRIGAKPASYWPWRTSRSLW